MTRLAVKDILPWTCCEEDLMLPSNYGEPGEFWTMNPAFITAMGWLMPRPLAVDGAAYRRRTRRRKP
jgi:hypothetical protein